ncbi:MAG: acyl-CoA thioester hydrolase/BAAT C-terminal domain-containing protein [Terriglobia bacterium]
MLEENFELRHMDRLAVPCTLRLPSSKGKFRLVVVGHGFLGFKDWGFLPHLCHQLTLSGFATLCFTHALAGIRENPHELTDLNALSSNSTTQELKDWELVLDAILCQRLPLSNTLRINAFGVMGHSRGGSYAILMARQTPQIQSVVTWGGISTFQRFDRAAQAKWREQGRLEVGRTPSGKPIEMHVNALNALERNEARLDVIRAVRELTIPVLFLHGREDKRVCWKESQKLWNCSLRDLTEFQLIELAGHTFRTPHPFQSPSQPLTEAIRRTIRWFERTLRE